MPQSSLPAAAATTAFNSPMPPPSSFFATALTGLNNPFGQPISWVEQTGSTNADLLAGAGDCPAASHQRPFEHGTVLIADSQTAGRGRHGRVWQTPPGAALLLSLVLRPPSVTRHRLTWLPLLTGLAVARALDAWLPTPAMLKWPNDVLVCLPDGPELATWGRRRKLAGILVEVAPGNNAGVVVGIGLNLTQQPGQLPVPWAVSLCQLTDSPFDRVMVAERVLDQLAGLYERWLANTPGLAAAIAARCWSVGDQVDDQGVLRRGLRLDDSGGLVLAGQHYETIITSGEIVSQPLNQL
ncbi:MAG: biotin--[acetyl-CoA-carboxylase] ligase [Bifidobacteriaceae bacterium]|jgi:BirA family biotin operon repressor/biotin-[acetyl-CoA-carboxylase] ligase|nr:biotin--[acetyl-CoA-carboxylase] ligase [Bifidobacteriaceae bacterium]